MADLDAVVRLSPKSGFVLNSRGLANADAERYDAVLADYALAIAVGQTSSPPTIIGQRLYRPGPL